MTALLWLAFAGTTVRADDAQKPPVVFMTQAQLAPNEKTIKQVEEYLSGLTTIVADFTQVAPDGSLSTGKFYLERPGRMRWQYNPPTPILMVANGSELVYYDYELDQISHIPLDQTLIGFLAQNPVRFDGAAGITEFTHQDDVIRITVAMRDKPSDGQLMLEFSDKPLLIRNMVVRDATGQITSVALNNARFGVAIDSKLFVFHDPLRHRQKIH